MDSRYLFADGWSAARFLGAASILFVLDAVEMSLFMNEVVVEVSIYLWKLFVLWGPVSPNICIL